MNVFNAYVKPFFIGFLLLFGSCVVVAEDTAKGAIKSLEPVNYGGKILFFLLFIIGLILLLAWLLSKTKVASSMMSQNNPELKTVAVLSLGIKEKIAVIKAGEKQFLVGITAQQINLISELETPITENETQKLSFQDFLKKAMRS